MAVSGFPGMAQSQSPVFASVPPRALAHSGLAISTLPLLSQLKCILVITSLITAKAICVHPPARSACCLAGIPAPLLRGCWVSDIESSGSCQAMWLRHLLEADRELPFQDTPGSRLTWPTGPTGSKHRVHRHVVNLSDPPRAGFSCPGSSWSQALPGRRHRLGHT